MSMERFGQYILLQKIGSGGMAELFKAKKIGIEGFERVLAIKRILPHLSSDEEFIDMFIEEAKLVARLSHKNITQIYDFGKIGQNYFIAMEYIKGKDLRSILKRCREKEIKLPVGLALSIAKEISSGLSYAHRQKDSAGKDLKIIHRDVSPQNILISYSGDVKVVDFGIAKAGGHSKTTTGVLKGKLSYMSPEQAWGKSIDHRSDIFSLGIVIYEMFTGERLFKGDSEINTLEKVRAANIEPLPSAMNVELSPGVESKMLKALARDVSERYQNASELEAALGEALFEILPTQSITLEEFMHDLFRNEIEDENRAELEEETVRFQVEEDTAVEYKTAPGTRPGRKKVFPYVAAALTGIAAVVIFLFVAWPKSASVPPAQKTPATLTESSVANKAAPANDSTIAAMPSGPSAMKKDSGGAAKEKSGARIEKAEKAALAAESQGSLTVNAVPWANVFIRGKAYGTTPKMVEGLKPGTYTVKLENPNFAAWETKVEISQGQTASISHKFGGMGRLVVNASPWGNVFLDGQLKGQTPLTIEKIPPGRHTLKVGREGLADFDKNVDIREGETEKVSAILKKTVDEDEKNR